MFRLQDKENNVLLTQRCCIDATKLHRILNMETETDTETMDGKGAGDGHEQGPLVTITIDTKPRKIHRGRQSVAEIKKAGEVPLAYELEQLNDGKLVALPDDGHVTIKGGEVFLSHPKDGGSS
jgi:hypothetical protein